MPNSNDFNEEDPFEKFSKDVNDAKGLLRGTSPSPENLKAHLVNTILPLFIELAGLASRSTDGLFDHFEERLDALSGGETQIFGEDAEKLMALADGVIWLTGELGRDGVDLQNQDMKTKLAAMKILANDCREIISSSRMEDDDEDESETDPSSVSN